MLMQFRSCLSKRGAKNYIFWTLKNRTITLGQIKRAVRCVNDCGQFHQLITGQNHLRRIKHAVSQCLQNVTVCIVVRQLNAILQQCMHFFWIAYTVAGLLFQKLKLVTNSGAKLCYLFKNLNSHAITISVREIITVLM